MSQPNLTHAVKQSPPTPGRQEKETLAGEVAPEAGSGKAARGGNRRRLAACYPLQPGGHGNRSRFPAESDVKAGLHFPAIRHRVGHEATSAALVVDGGVAGATPCSKLVEVFWFAGPFTHRFRVTQAGRERGEWLMAVSGYVGPAPVSLPAYTSMLHQQLPRLPNASPQTVAAALSDLVLPQQTGSGRTGRFVRAKSVPLRPAG